MQRPRVARSLAPAEGSTSRRQPTFDPARLIPPTPVAQALLPNLQDALEMQMLAHPSPGKPDAPSTAPRREYIPVRRLVSLEPEIGAPQFGARWSTAGDRIERRPSLPG